MEFGYFTLSDNNYDDIKRTPEEFILEIREQALYADKIGMHSAWIGEHHFDSLGVNSCPHMVLASIVTQTKRIRMAPAVTVLPMHHPLRVAEEWATLDLLSGGRVDFAVGRGYDRKEYEPFGADYMTSLERMEEGIDIIKKAWETDGKWSHKGQFYTIDNMAITPRPLQKHVPFFMACFSKASMEIAGRKGMDIIFAPFAAALTFGDLGTAVRSYHEECAKYGQKPGKAMCSYFIHIGEGKDEQYGRDRQIAYFRRAVKPAIAQDPSKSPPSMLYMNKIVDILDGVNAGDLGEKSILLGSAQKITDTLKRVEESGMEEVILYFNCGGKPHSMVLEQMDQFMSEIAPHFSGSHIKVRAEAAE